MVFTRKNWFSREEREVRHLLKRMVKNKILCTYYGLREIGTTLCQSYSEMLQMLRCVDRLYEIAKERGYHTTDSPIYNGDNSFYPCDLNRHIGFWLQHNSDLQELISKMMECEDFSVIDDFLVPVGKGKPIEQSTIEDRLKIGEVRIRDYEYETHLKEAAESGWDVHAPVPQHLHYYWYGRVIPRIPKI